MRAPGLKLFVAGGVLVAVGLGVLVSPFASTRPDGLDRVALDKGFAEAERPHDLSGGPLADYELVGISNARVATALSGLVGVLLTFGAGLLLFAALRARATQETEPGPGDDG
jgi:cobalt/nickel transport protein